MGRKLEKATDLSVGKLEAKPGEEKVRIRLHELTGGVTCDRLHGRMKKNLDEILTKIDRFVLPSVPV